MNEYILARAKFKPCDKVNFLLIAESPPASGGYFYFDYTTGRDSLFSETMKALELFPEGKTMSKGFYKVPLLKEFQRQGFFLIDVSYEPVNGLPNSERKHAVEKEIPRLVDDTQKLNPENIIIVKVTIFDNVKKALAQAGLEERILNKEPLPFPSTGNQKKYRQMLRRLLLR
jgi:hypothetical protein